VEFIHCSTLITVQEKLQNLKRNKNKIPACIGSIVARVQFTTDHATLYWRSLLIRKIYKQILKLCPTAEDSIVVNRFPKKSSCESKFFE